jgi:hypothetical protein
MTSGHRKATGENPPLYRPHEVAKVLRCSEWWVKEQARRRRIPFSWIGGSYRFTDEHIAEIIRRFEVQPDNDHTTSGQASGRRRRPSESVTQRLLTAKPPARARRHPSESDHQG